MKSSFTKKLIPAIALLLLLSSNAKSQYNNKIPIPPTVTGDTIKILVQESTWNFNPSGSITIPGSDTVDVDVVSFCYNSPDAVPAPGDTITTMRYLGPTQIWVKNQPLQIMVTNLTSQVTTTHWHGANLPSEDDGGPQEEIPWLPPNNHFDPQFTVRDSAQTHWYHSHWMDHTTQQVAMGEAGMIIVEDPNDVHRDQLPNQYGVNDFPIIFTEKGFTHETDPATGPMVIDTGQHQTVPHPHNQFYTPINGVINGYIKVPQDWARLRILNGAMRKSFQFGLVQGPLKNPFNAATPLTFANPPLLNMIATDGGYIPAPIGIDSIIIAPGERMEFVVDFGQFANGDTVYLMNLQRGINSGIIISATTGGVVTQGSAFMAFLIDNTIVPDTSIASLPASLDPNVIDTTNVKNHRTKHLYGASGSGGVWTIDSLGYDMMTINDILLENSKEIWSINNLSNVAHPFHIHKTEFQVISIDSISGVPPNPNQIVGTIPVPPQWNGPKDVVLVHPNWSVNFVARFDSFPNSGIGSIGFDSAFMYHCHILTHEDVSMMHQFIVVDSLTWCQLYPGDTAVCNNIMSRNVTLANGFAIYPNPATDQIVLNGKSNLQGTLRFSDLLGRTLREVKTDSFNGSLSFYVGDLPRGMVLVEWFSAENRITKKVILD
jgi:FtsP/CotA-like multicopper oxidase with cupredoxin domain